MEVGSSGSAQKDPCDTVTNVLARTPAEDVYEDLNIGDVVPTRPKPRRRKRPTPIVADDELVPSVPFDKGFQRPFSPLSPEPQTPNPVVDSGKENAVDRQVSCPIQMEYEEDSIEMRCAQDTLVLSSPPASKQVDGDLAWENGGEHLEDVHDETSIYLPSHHGSPALQVDSEDVPSEAFSRLMSRMERPVPGAMEWQGLDEILHNNSGLSISLPLGEDAIPDTIVTAERSGSRCHSISADSGSWTVGESVAAALQTRSKSQSSSRAHSPAASQSSERSGSPPILSRIGLRNRKRSVEMAKESEQRELGYPSSTLATPMSIGNENATLYAPLSSATSSSSPIFSSGPSRFFERPSGRRRGGVSARVRATMFEDGSQDLSSSQRESITEQSIHSTESQHVEQELPRSEKERPIVRERTISSGSEEDWCILPDFKTPTQSTSRTRSQQPNFESASTSPGNRPGDCASNTNVNESPNTVRRGTRVRKATDKKEYVPLSHIIRKSCRKSLAESAAATVLPGTPGAAGQPSSSRSDIFSQTLPMMVESPPHPTAPSSGKSLSRVIASLGVKSPFLATSSPAVQSSSFMKSPAFKASLGSATISPPRRRRAAPQAGESKSKGNTSNARSLGRNNTSLPETSTPAVSVATSPRLCFKIPVVQKPSHGIPFPPNPMLTESNEYFIVSDLQDVPLMAVCAVLHDGGNKAMGVADIAEACVKYNWLQDE